MSNSYEGSVLLGALLDRLGKPQAQVLLARLDQWLSLDNRGAPLENIRSEPKQFDAVEAPYDRRKHGRDKIHNSDSNSASWTPKDRQS
jgi:hypothetical protein